jgi:hypothetical protein
LEHNEINQPSFHSFQHDKYWRISSLNGSLISRPRSLEDYWPELLQWPVKAVVEVDNETLFFVGKSSTLSMPIK